MPFLRFARDKRGYENIYLVHTQTRRGKTPRQRILYWYRTPPGVRVGRPPFDEEARRRIEAQNPDLSFDWPTIVATPIPPPAENEQWRERRRAERAAKHAHRAEEEALRAERDAGEESMSAIEPESPRTSRDDTPESLPVAVNVGETARTDAEPQPRAEDDVPAEIPPEASEAAITMGPGDRALEQAARRRRRRGGRRRRGRRHLGADASGQIPSGEGSNPVEPTVQDRESNESVPDSESAEFDVNDE